MKRLPKDDEIVVLALNDVKHDLLSYPNKRKDIEILKPETRQMKKLEMSPEFRLHMTVFF